MSKIKALSKEELQKAAQGKIKILIDYLNNHSTMAFDNQLFPKDVKNLINKLEQKDYDIMLNFLTGKTNIVDTQVELGEKYKKQWNSEWLEVVQPIYTLQKILNQAVGIISNEFSFTR